MNKTKIEWADMTWNPVTGCLHGCPYCYAKRTAENPFYRRAFPYKFEPHFYPERLNEPAKMKKPQTIFVCSMADLFGEWVPAKWIWEVFQAMDAAPQHTFIMLTKNPEMMKSFAPEKGDQPRGVKENWWFGTSVTCQIDTIRIKPLREMDGNRFISFEPLLRDVGPLELIGSPFKKEPDIKQVIIGAQTNPSVEVTPEMVQPIGAATCPGVVPTIKMFCKDSMPTWAMCRRELAWPLNKSTEWIPHARR
jgi:protein gp37